ncbi:hypothetical protein [Arcticibacterium luteifluviistationis]|uniref:Uncharacterized protein n=1 Tax=Arcticibacterium luteifluviistationis TaxID=1784714 RepID=A0A2Z4GAZ6_9BACT|nr:hypothetical protein [Arcticibacterium luteifluviistationis]AWV98210.1 hypothetical protein DJ013_08500 [Arcticibacterium luteifluviistationis]
MSTLKEKNMSNTLNKLLLLAFTLFAFIHEGYSQNNADPGIGILMSPSIVIQGSTGILSATVGNYGNETIVENSLRVTITVGSNAEIIGIAPGSDSRWSQLSLTTGSANSIKLTNTVGGFNSFDVGDILLTVRGNLVSAPELILGNIVYITAENPLLCDGCPSPPYNVSQGNASSLNDNSQTSLATSAPVIDAVVDATAAVSGLTGGITSALTSNDSLNGIVVVIGIDSGNVTLTGLNVPAGLTLNADGTVTVDSNTPAGNYNVEYKICEVNNPTNCDSVISMIVVSAPIIAAVVDTTAAVSGLTGGITSALTSNDSLNGIVVVIGIDSGNVMLTGLTVPAGLTLNADGTVTVDSNTPAGNYNVEYKICEVNNPTNCDSVISMIVVSAPIIAAVVDTTAAVSGLTGGITSALTSNDSLNGIVVVIGIDSGNVTLTGLNVPAGLTLNADGTVTVDSNTPAGNYNVEYKICEVNNPTNCDSVISMIVVSAPIIAAVVDTTAAVSGLTGGITSALTSNDSLNGIVVVIGIDSGNVMLTGLTVPAGLTLNADGTVTVDSNTPAGNYNVEYKICEVNNPTNCDSVISMIVVSAPIIAAVVDTTAAVSGLTGGITSALTSNDSLNGIVVVIGIDSGNVTLTGLNVPAGLTLNADGTVTVDSNTPAGNYNVEYKICEVNNPTNCDSVISMIEVYRELPDLSPTIDIDALVFPIAGSAKDFVVNIGDVKGVESDGQVVVKVSKGNAFFISYADSTSNSNANGGSVPVNNSAWIITENASFITITLKPGVQISANTFSAIGFTITRKAGVPTQTSQPITVTIVNGTGLDSQNSNNAYSTIVTAQ